MPDGALLDDVEDGAISDWPVEIAGSRLGPTPPRHLRCDDIGILCRNHRGFLVTKRFAVLVAHGQDAIFASPGSPVRSFDGRTLTTISCTRGGGRQGRRLWACAWKLSCRVPLAIQLAIGVEPDGVLGKKAGVEGVLRQRKTGGN